MVLSVLSLANLIVFMPDAKLFADNLRHCLGVGVSFVNAGAFGLMLGEIVRDPVCRFLRFLHQNIFGDRDNGAADRSSGRIGKRDE